MNIHTNITQSIFPSGIMVWAGALLLIGTGTAQAETYTGCVTPGGTIIHLAAGESPAKPCQNRQHLIHLDDRHAYQNPDAHYNHAKVCEAFHDLSVDPGIREAMGCPSDPAVVEPGTVKRVQTDDLLNSNFNICNGILKVEQNDEWGVGFHWVVDGRTGDPLPEDPGGGYIAKHVKLPRNSTPIAVEQCETMCKDDPKCIAAEWFVGGNGTSPTGDCEIYHFSDTVPHASAGWCGLNAGLEFAGCAGVLLESGNNGWFVRCDGTLVQ